MIVAMPDLTRRFELLDPVKGGVASIELKEPSLTGDQLGHKTWAASYLLAKRLTTMQIPPLSKNYHASSSLPHVLELGAGTGLVGLAIAALFSTNVHLTDLAAIVPNLEANVSANASAVAAKGSRAKAFKLDWAEMPDVDSTTPPQSHSYDVVVAADPIYGPEHPGLLVGAVERYLSTGKDARLALELPLRAAYAPEVQDLRERLDRANISLLEEGEEVGFDDWGDGRTEVRCWWSLWGRVPAQPVRCP